MAPSFAAVALLRLLVSFASLTFLGLAQLQEHPEDTSDGESRAYLDTLITDHMAKDQVLGASVVVVRNGQIWYQRGFGFADEKKSKPVDAQNTEFYAASISKLFVATAVMQLAEQGRLDLHRDINNYLDFQIGTFRGSRAVTLADLLTHTSGLDDHMIGAESPIREPVDLRVYFRNHVPVPIREPGAEIDYSNHGVALAAHIVECVSQMRFYEYVEQRILMPLEMSQSSFRQPLPELLRKNVAFERFEKPYTILYPVATLVATPIDMAKFMLAELKVRRFSARLLTDDSLDDMHAQHFAPSLNLPGMAYGFFEAHDGGGRGLFHAGARDHFSLLYLVPKQRFGIYVVMCGASEQSQLPREVVREFLRHLFGAPDARHAAAAPAVIPEWLPGRYRLDAISHSTLEKLVGLGAEMRVKRAGTDIDVILPSFSRGESTERYAQVSPLLFRSKSGALVQFRRPSQSSEAKAFRSDFVSDPMSLTRLHWYESSTFFLFTMALSYGVFGIFLLLSLYWAIRKRNVAPRHWVWHLGTVLSLCVLVAPAAGILMALMAREHQLYTIQKILSVVMSIVNPGIVLAIVVIALIPSVVLDTRWPTRARILFGALGLASLFFVRFVSYWHVWGYRF